MFLYRVFGVSIILIAIVLSGIRWVKPSYHFLLPKITQFLEIQLESPVVLEEVQLEVHGARLALGLKKLAVFDPQTKVQRFYFEEIQLVPKLFRSLWHRKLVLKAVFLKEADLCWSSATQKKMTWQDIIQQTAHYLSTTEIDVIQAYKVNVHFPWEGKERHVYDLGFQITKQKEVALNTKEKKSKINAYAQMKNLVLAEWFNLEEGEHFLKNPLSVQVQAYWNGDFWEKAFLHFDSSELAKKQIMNKGTFVWLGDNQSYIVFGSDLHFSINQKTPKTPASFRLLSVTEGGETSVEFFAAYLPITLLKMVLSTTTTKTKPWLTHLSPNGTVMYMNGFWKPNAKKESFIVEGRIQGLGVVDERDSSLAEGINALFTLEEDQGSAFLYSQQLGMQLIEKPALQLEGFFAKLNYFYDPLGTEVVLSEVKALFSPDIYWIGEGRFSFVDMHVVPEISFWLYNGHMPITQLREVLGLPFLRKINSGTLIGSKLILAPGIFEWYSPFQDVFIQSEIPLSVRLKKGVVSILGTGGAFMAEHVLFNEVPYELLQSAWTTEGNKFELQNCIMKGPQGSISMTGSWDLKEGGQNYLKGNVAASNLGDWLSFLGLHRGFQHTSGTLKGNLQWIGDFSNIQTDTLNGELAIQTGSGYIEGVDPGVGRIFSLLNIHQLLKNLKSLRLTEDRQGYSFDSMRGDLRFQDGYVHTNNLHIQSTEADLTFKGNAHLNNKTLSGEVIVDPHLSSSLPITAVLTAANPALGAAIFAFNKITDKEITPFSTFYYRVGGTWDKPTVTSLSIQPGKESK